MGLFDTIYSNYKLPDVVVNDSFKLYFNKTAPKQFGYETEFQTKSLESLMDRYFITTQGRLILQSYNVNVDTDYHGMLHFYTTVDVEDFGKYFIEYNAKFTDGKLIQVGGECLKSL